MTKKTIIKARGVLKQGNKVLFCYNKLHNFFFLPGGTVKIEENAPICLHREFKEECQLYITVGSFLGCLECHWKDEKNIYQEFNMIFNVYNSLGYIPDHITSTETHISFSFLPYQKGVITGIYRILPIGITEFLKPNGITSKYIAYP
ncbi:MAG: NUDIX domain-containing protein [Bacteroidota bacterium]